MPRATTAVVAPRVGRSLRSLCRLSPARVLPVDRSTRAGRPQEASCSTGAKAAVSASSAMHGDELMARAPEHCDQADIMPLVDSPAVQTRESDMLMHNETLRTAVGAASTPVQLGSSRAAAGGDSAAGAETGGHSQGRARLARPRPDFHGSTRIGALRAAVHSLDCAAVAGGIESVPTGGGRGGMWHRPPL